MPILSRVLEKLIFETYLWLALERDADLINDQFAYRPTGSITSLLIKMLHNIHQMFESGSNYVGFLSTLTIANINITEQWPPSSVPPFPSTPAKKFWAEAA